MGSSSSKESDINGGWKSHAMQAMESGASCVICGSPFDLHGNAHNIDPRERQYKWLSSFRLLGRVEDVDRHRVTCEDSRPTNISKTGEIFLSERARYSATGSQYFHVPGNNQRSDIWLDVLLSSSHHGTLFPLHGACMRISIQAIQYACLKYGWRFRGHSLSVLCDLLNARWNDYHSSQKLQDSDSTVNDTFDLCSSSGDHQPRSVLALSEHEWGKGDYDVRTPFCSRAILLIGSQRYYTDPIDITEELHDFVFEALQYSYNGGQQSTRNGIQATEKTSGMEKLPREILNMVCGYIPACDVIRLNRTSKTMSAKIPLDNTFWRTNLHNGSLLPYIWDLDTEQIEQRHMDSNLTSNGTNWNWRSVAKALATRRFPASGNDPQFDGIPLGLWNRSRIWTIAEEAMKEYRLRQSEIERKDSTITSQKRSNFKLSGDTSSPNSISQ